MDNKIKNESVKIGDIINTPQGEKYQILQRINTSKKAQKELLPTFYDHIDTFIVKRHSNKVYYILKRFHIFYQKGLKQSPIQSPSKEKSALKQIKNKQLFHPNLLIIEEAFFQKNTNTQKQHKTLILIQQYCQQGDLAYFVKYEAKKCFKGGKKETFSQKIISKWLLQILLALQHLHFHKSTHQVLTPNNIYLTPLGNLKLNDYYFLNLIAGIKDIKKLKDSSPIIEGYEPMVNEKKFRVNEKKDIFDFGILISYLCNSKAYKNSKKQEKNKSFVHLPSSYTQDLNKIYLSCINVKKTGLQVKDILRTTYFLQVMRQFIVDKKLNISLFERIPIKKYMIHKKSLTSKPQSSKLQKKENDKQMIDIKLPRIDKIQKPTDMKQSNRKVQKNQTKQMNQTELKKAMRASLEKLKNKIDINKQKLSKEKKFRKNSVDQTKQQKQLNRKLSKQKPKLLIPIPSSKESSKVTLKPPPSLPKNKKTDIKSNDSPINENKKQARSSRQQVRSRQKQKRERISRSQSGSPKKKTIDDSKKYHLTPQITFGKKVPNNSINVESPSIKIAQPLPEAQLNPVNQDSKLTQLQKISQNLAKIFSDLKIRQDDDQQLSFQLDQSQEQQLRLTLKQQKQGGQSEENLMKTYKWKFDEIVSELQQKYQPNMETIIQKTTEWDSNDFFVNQELLKRLRLQQGKQQITFGN